MIYKSKNRHSHFSERNLQSYIDENHANESTSTSIVTLRQYISSHTHHTKNKKYGHLSIYPTETRTTHWGKETWLLVPTTAAPAALTAGHQDWSPCIVPRFLRALPPSRLLHLCTFCRLCPLLDLPSKGCSSELDLVLVKRVIMWRFELLIWSWET